MAILFGHKLNWFKFTEPPTALGVDFHERVNILGVEFGPTIATSIRDSWSRVVCAVRAQARQAYTRHLCLVQRMQYVQPRLFAKIWRIAQIFPLPLVQAQQLTAICSWYLRQGTTFRAPLGPFKGLNKMAAGVYVAVKCKTLL